MKVTMRMALTAALLWLAVTNCAVGSPEGKLHVLLVGVSEYPNLDEGDQLYGPKNDVQLWAQYFSDSGVVAERMHVLTDQVQTSDLPGDYQVRALPTRSEIVGALEGLADSVEPNDFVFLFFAGHGTQQPVTEATVAGEPDAWDEVFMPRDVGGWDMDQVAGGIRNGILDDEFNRLISGIRDAGAFVWAVFDTCHSATMTRSAVVPEVRYRGISSTKLGVPQEAIDTAQELARLHHGASRSGRRSDLPSTRSSLGPVSGRHRGGMVGFYAVQSNQEAPEMRLPIGQRGATQFGMFSYYLHEVVRTAPRSATYQQIIGAVLQRTSSLSSMQTKGNAVPMADGSDLDQPMFGGLATTPRQSWDVRTVDGRSLSLDAGRLHGLAVDTVMALYPTATAAESDLLGYAKIMSADPVSSVLQPMAFDGVPAPASLPQHFAARPVGRELSFDLSIQLVEGQAGPFDCSRLDAATRAAVDHLAARLDDPDRPPDFAPGLRLRWMTSSDQDPDTYLLCQRDDRIHIIRRDSEADDGGAPVGPFIPVHPSLESAPSLEEALADALTSVARVANLMRVIGSRPTDSFAVRTTYSVWRRPADQRADACPETRTDLTADIEEHEQAAELSMTAGDCLFIQIHNPSLESADITILHINADYGIHVLWPSERQYHNPRIEAGGRITLGGIRAAANRAGRERVLVLAVPVPRSSRSLPTSLTYLAQPSIGQTRSRNAGSIVDLIEQAGFGTERRWGHPVSSRSGARTSLYASLMGFNVQSVGAD